MSTGKLIDLFSVLILGSLPWAAFSLDVEYGSFKQGLHTTYTGLYIMVWGVLFLLSFYFTKDSYLLRLLRWVCEHFSWPAHRKMAFFYFALAFISGGYTFLIGIGVANAI